MALTFGLIAHFSRNINKRIYIGTRFCSTLIDSTNETATNEDESFEIDRKIGLNRGQQKSMLRRKPDYKEGMETLKVALIGAPNAGKSTIANRILGWKFVPVSQKVHTTRSKTMGVITEENKQVVFLDTPGIILPSKMRKHNLELSLLVDPHQALCESDLIMVVVDVSNVWSRARLDTEVLKMLAFHKDKKAILVLNKVDTLKHKAELLQASRLLTQGHLDGKRFYESEAEKKKKDKEMGPQDLKVLFEKCKDMKSPDLMEEEEDVAEEEASSPTQAKPSKPQQAKIKCPEDMKNLLEKRESFQSIMPEKWNLRDDGQWQLYYMCMHNIGRNIKQLTSWPFFKDIFMISAKQGDGIAELKNYLLASTKPSPWQYDANVVTDQDPKELAEQLVREKLLDNLPSEIPYQIRVKRVMWLIGEDNLLRAQFELHCEKRRHLQTLIGKDGAMIQRISSEVKQELMNAFRREMSLQLIVRGNENTQKIEKVKFTKKPKPEQGILQ